MEREPEEEYPSFRRRSERYSRLEKYRSNRSRKWMAELKDGLITAAAVFAVMSLLNLFVFNISMVKGRSMQPTLYEGERLFINKITLAFDNPKRGDVIVLHDPSSGPDRKEYLVKRVIGLPGDIVEVREHRLYVNGKPSEETYVDTIIEDADFAPVTVGKGLYFIMGDNRHAGASKDSRYFGPVPLKLIVGRAAYIWWPLSKMNTL
ncbi:signal peptidase I [Paenibacillus sophorae]|uniref:Signal peptidase I n=1 Tax=Paenibacillus sophorae TaxID=1333845 RepID=A0A1H8S8Z0_9BACL|nr:signal peptidase I [Paenibacillus sophorae]QWU16830.1 signal peptidase I [Paenibacillus sophorae]SEO75017.1 signal peptidase I [Paenibacillus sophorae]